MYLDGFPMFSQNSLDIHLGDFPAMFDERLLKVKKQLGIGPVTCGTIARLKARLWYENELTHTHVAGGTVEFQRV